MTAAPAISSLDSLASHRAELTVRLAGIRDPQARLAWVLEQARLRPHLPEALRQEQHRVTGCLVRLWFVPEFRDGRCWFQSDSDAVSLRALTGLLCALANGGEPAEVAQFDHVFLEQLGLLRQLAESRRATVLRVAEMIREFGRRHTPG